MGELAGGTRSCWAPQEDRRDHPAIRYVYLMAYKSNVQATKSLLAVKLPNCFEIMKLTHD